MPGKEPSCRSVVQTDDSLHKFQALRRAERPTLREHVVVDIIKAYAGHLTKDIERMEYFLQIGETYVPGPLLVLNDRFQGSCGGPMASAGVKIDEINFCHYCFIP